MGLITSLFGPKTRSVAMPEQRGLPYGLMDLGGGRSAAGVTVTEDSAMTSSAVWACVKVLSESMAVLPLITYQRQGDGGKNRAYDYPLYELLHDEPNPEMTSFDFRLVQGVHLTTWGNFYAEKVWGRNGYLRELIEL